MDGKTFPNGEWDLEVAPCEFESDGLICRGYFYSPRAEPPYPCVVMTHGFGASPDGPLGDIARRLAAAGVSAFAFDFRHFGVSDGRPRQVLDIEGHLSDWGAAIAYVRGRDRVDPSRVGLWGSSLSGGEVLAVAARDHTLAAVVAQVPYADGHSIARAIGLRQHLRMMPAIVRDLIRAATGQPPYLIEGIGSSGRSAMVLVGADDLQELTSRAPSWPNRMAARSLLPLYRFRPIQLASQIRCPLLVVLTYQDGISPSDVAAQAAEALPYVELAMFQAEHFDLYAGDTYERAVRTEVRFFGYHFGPAGGAAMTPPAASDQTQSPARPA